MGVKLPAILRNLPIRSKLVGGYALVFLIAVLLGGGVVYYRVRTTIEAHIESELTNATAAILNMVKTAASTSIKNHLRAAAEKNLDIITAIHADFLQGKISEPRAKELCRKILFSQTIGRTGYIFCASSGGIAVEHPNPGVAGKRFTDRQFVQEMIAKKTGYLEYDWKNPEEARFRPKAMYMSYFAPWDWIIAVSSYREEFKALINIDDFRDSILSLKFGKSGYAYINDTKGNLVVHPFLTGNYYGLTDKHGHPFVRDIIAMKNGKKIYSWKNPGEPDFREKMVIFNYLPEYDWIISSASYLDEIYAPLDTIRNVIAVIVLVICVLVITASLWINASVVGPLRDLMKRFNLGASGNFTIRMPVRSKDEIGQLAGYFNRFMDRLEAYGRKLKEEADQSRRLEREILSISERERQKIAMELHDDLCPQLIGIEVMVQTLKKRLENREGTKGEATEARSAARIRCLIRDAIAKTRHLSQGLSPVNLADRGFDASLKDLAAHVREVFHMDCSLDFNARHPFSDNATATHAYYIIHEAVHNAVKHARADLIRISLDLDEDRVRIRVDDNGRGMTEPHNETGMGIRIMSFRAERMGGQLAFGTPPGGRGTRVCLTVKRNSSHED